VLLIHAEPDSLANLVTNLNVQKCANAATAYKTLTTYAIKTLNMKNVIMYLDAGHAGWLGWPANIGPAADLFGALYKGAGSPASVRGLVTNVANYNAWSIATCPAYAESNANCDEKKYVNALAPLLVKAGFPAHFLTDTGTSLTLLLCILLQEVLTIIPQAAAAFSRRSKLPGATGATLSVLVLVFDPALLPMIHCWTLMFGSSLEAKVMELLIPLLPDTMHIAVLRMLSSRLQKQAHGSRPTSSNFSQMPTRHSRLRVRLQVEIVRVVGGELSDG
jgi:hypothetical protein